MIDIHAHVIPFIDDGSDAMEKSIEMLKYSAQIGVTDVVCTPHYRAPFLVSKQQILDAFEKLKLEVEKNQIPVNLYLGQEIAVGENVKKLLSNGEVFSLNGTPWVLVEFDFNRRCEIVETVHELKTAGYYPIVAHLERYYYADEDMAFEIKSVGGYIQVNAGSLVGDVDKRIRKFVKNIFKFGLVDFVSSDVHFGRENLLDKAEKFIKSKYGDAAAKVTLHYNPNKIIKG